jgi:ferritin-like metal-binding protein YciE
MKGIVTESSETIEEKKSDSEGVLDVAIAGGARRVEHYEIAGYTAAIDMARELGHEEVAGLLEETLQEEREADEKLGEISKRILQEAVSAEQAGSEEDEEQSAPSRGKTKAAR